MKKIRSKATEKKSNQFKLLSAAFLLTGACSLLFYGLTASAMAMELRQTEAVPTVYPMVFIPKEEAATVSLPAASDYHVLDDSLYDNKGLTGNNLSKEEAADIGVRLVEDLFGAALDDAYVYMGFTQGTSTFPRAFWSGDIRLTDAKRKPGDDCYGFMIDAVTGECFNIASSRTLKADVPLGMDAALSKDNSAYRELAEKFVKEKGLVTGAVSRVEYNCQGYAGNDPDITFDIYGEKGEKLTLTFSRYDKAFTGAIFDAYYRIDNGLHNMTESAVSGTGTAFEEIVEEQAR